VSLSELEVTGNIHPFSSSTAGLEVSRWLGCPPPPPPPAVPPCWTATPPTLFQGLAVSYQNGVRIMQTRAPGFGRTQLNWSLIPTTADYSAVTV